MKTYIIFLACLLPLLLSSCQENTNDPFDITYESDLPYASYLSENNPLVMISIADYGDIFVELFPEVAQITVDNFIAYIQSNAYEGSTFHRVIDDFMIQGGIVSNTACAITGEFGNNGIFNNLNHYPGVIAMARTGFPNSATSQFFINEVYNSFLNNNYASFGGVVLGFDIVEAISEVSTTMIDEPVDDVIIDSVSIQLRGYEPNNRTCHS